MSAAWTGSSAVSAVLIIELLTPFLVRYPLYKTGDYVSNNSTLIMDKDEKA
jgi:hypothetical protein